MSTYFTDFHEYTAEQQPDGWTERFETDGSWTTKTDAGVTGGKRVLFDPVGGLNDPRGLSWNLIDSDTERQDCDLVALVRMADSTKGSLGVFCRGSGGSGAEYCYSGQISTDSATVVMRKRVNGVGSIIGTPAAKVYGDNEWWWVRFRVNGSDLKIRAWEDGESEPGAWDQEETDSDVTGDGWAGCFSHIRDRSDQRDIDVLGIGTNGDNAPTSAGEDRAAFTRPSNPLLRM